MFKADQVYYPVFLSLCQSHNWN